MRGWWKSPLPKVMASPWRRVMKWLLETFSSPLWASLLSAKRSPMSGIAFIGCLQHPSNVMSSHWWVTSLMQFSLVQVSSSPVMRKPLPMGRKVYKILVELSSMPRLCRISSWRKSSSSLICNSLLVRRVEIVFAVSKVVHFV